MTVLTKLTAAEAKVFLRDPGAPAVVAGIPLALLLVFGLLPGADRPDPKYGGHSGPATVIADGRDDPARHARPLLGHFTGLRPLGEVDTGAAEPSSFDGVPLWLATGRTEPWPGLWPQLVNTHT
ncbi:hypothetical protein [Amycolatopsis australiensis]|uniref:Uncharacterized protein n=1 Tax=Amycolatopsis australiensis TaxID=546364 RepID=A0A1K1SUV7_9PSEU|nr:hypothetical protein [Amycolatopsis australiensis]SFW88192.1 hypothetical protein SAMN04489730_6889 [Amycolatopsis australiensis]